MFKVIVFDMDDTLYKEMDFVVEGFKAVSEYLALKYDLEQEKILTQCIDILNSDGRGKIFNKICYKFSLNEDIDRLITVYRQCKPNINLYEDAYYLLNKLKEYKYKLAIITDGKSSVQWNKIKALNLDNMVDKIIVTDDFGRDFWKPHELSYKKIVEEFSCKPEECIYIGDNPNKDFIGAKKLGFKTVRIIREVGDHMRTVLSKEYEADYNITNLKEILDLLKES